MPNEDSLRTADSLREAGQFERAVTIYQELLRANPRLAAAHDGLGMVLARQGHFAQAAEAFSRAAQSAPGETLYLFNLASAYFELDDLPAAAATLKRVLAIAPGSLRAHYGLAIALGSLGHHAEAIEHFREVVRQQPNEARAYFEMGNAYYAREDHKQAAECFRTVLRIKPDAADALANLALIDIQRGRYEEAIDQSLRAIQIDPTVFPARLNLGIAYTKHEDYELAVTALEEAARLKPDSAEVRMQMGIALSQLGRFEEAEASFQRALDQKYLEAKTLHNLAMCRLRQKKVLEALEYIDRSLALDNTNADGHINRAGALLLLGRFAEGFEAYERRFETKQAAPLNLRWPRWNGSPLSGRTIVCCVEQGIGDVFQFVRYTKVLKDQGARVIVECRELLHPILSRTTGIDQLIKPDEPATADCCIPMLSLPGILGTRMETIPADVPYLFADQEYIDIWKRRLAERDGFKVGIVWQGNPTTVDDRYRSIPLAQFAPLAAVTGVQLINLQKGHGYEQLAAVRDSWRVWDFGAELDAKGAFLDTAAIMKNLNLMITSDTSTAHLAGSLAIPVWVALEFVPDWRWFLDRDDSPWYPTMRLFRQSKRGDWTGVFERMVRALAELLRSIESPS